MELGAGAAEDRVSCDGLHGRQFDDWCGRFVGDEGEEGAGRLRSERK